MYTQCVIEYIAYIKYLSLKVKHIFGAYCIVSLGNPPQYSCLENPVDRGAWWAAVYAVTQSQTQLKRLSSSSSRPAYRFLKRQIRWSGIPTSFRIFHSSL